jgi:hypothetical protein
MNALRPSLIMTTVITCFCAVGSAQQGAPLVDEQDPGIIGRKSIFLRDRRPAAIPVPPPPPPVITPEERFVLRGVVIEQDAFRAYVENLERGALTQLRLGDRVAGGEVAEIQIDGIRYLKDGSTESVWVGPGRNLTGSVSNLRESRR